MAPPITLGIVLLLWSYAADAGVSYIRWGRTECPAGVHTLYKGYMAASFHSEGGNGANTLCLPDTPQFVRGKPGFQGRSARLAGIELDVFEIYEGLFLTTNVPGGRLTEQDMPCVRCYVESAFDAMMIPGRQDCYGTGYTLQYKGYLVAEESNNRPRGEYVCLDEAPEATPGGSGDNNQAIVYPVEIQCGSIPCSPYVDGIEATCAVCTH